MILFLIFILNLKAAQPKLQFIQVVFRHGARYPVHKNYKFNLQMEGQLTPQGMRMHYILGKKMKKKYIQNQKYKLINKTYDHHQLYVRSTNVDRTLMSAQSHLLGMFQKEGPNITDSDLAKMSFPPFQQTSPQETGPAVSSSNYQPVPIHTMISKATTGYEGDFLDGYDISVCPNQKLWMQQNKKLEIAQRVNSSMKDTLQKLKADLKTDEIIDIVKASQYMDTFICNQYLKIPNPDIFESIRPQLSYIQAITLYLGLFLTDQQIKITISPFFLATIQNLKNLEKQKHFKWIIYSAHDTTIGNILAGLQLASAQCIEAKYNNQLSQNQTCIQKFPQFATSIIFQVWNYSGLYSQVKILYNGEVLKQIPICKNKTNCSLPDFISSLKGRIIQNYRQQCGFHEGKSNFLWIFILALGIIVAIMSGFLIYKFLNNHQKKRKQLLAEGLNIHEQFNQQ